MRPLVFVGEDTHPHKNLALERYFTRTLPPETCLMYLWQNENAVVVGKNQNLRAECDLAAMKAMGTVPARRLSGGGAVYHDLGNLNFSFIAPKGIYDVNRQLDVILRSVNAFGLNAARSGRNDIQIDGAKFSGNAFLHAENSCHHGTILIDTSMDRLAAALRPSGEKLRAKGVPSVRARVVNLSQLGAVSVDAMKKSLVEAFALEYGGTPEALDPAALDREEVERLYAFFSSEAFLYNDSRTMPYRVARRFAWGMAEVGFSVCEGKIADIQVFTDAMEQDLAQAIQQAFLGRALEDEAPHDPAQADVWNAMREEVEG